MKALILVDIQNDFLPGGALPAPEGDKIIPVINNLSEHFDMVIASRDWHPVNSRHFDNWPPHCIKETAGANFPDGLSLARVTKEFRKGTGDKDDGYSAFEATNENLSDYLRKHLVSELYICGLTTEHCVKETAIDAARSGFETFVIKDAVSGVKANPVDEEKAFHEMEENGVLLTDSNQIIH